MWRRSPVVAGSFYPSNPERLKNDIDRYLKDAGPRSLKSEILALIVPHAGYVYSGPVAAYSYAQLAGAAIDIAVVLAPSHRARFNGASIVPSGVFETPLGEVKIDPVIGEALEKQPHFKFIKEAHQHEHSLEVQLPFMQRVIPGFALVPVIIGSVDFETCEAIAHELHAVLAPEKRSCVIVISTDLSHYYSYDQARRLDGAFVESLKKFDATAMYRALSMDEVQACGEGPVLVGLMLGSLLKARGVEILKYANSGDTAGGRDQVVGYLAAAIIK